MDQRFCHFQSTFFTDEATCFTDFETFLHQYYLKGYQLHQYYLKVYPPDSSWGSVPIDMYLLHCLSNFSCTHYFRWLISQPVFEGPQPKIFCENKFLGPKPGTSFFPYPIRELKCIVTRLLLAMQSRAGGTNVNKRLPRMRTIEKLFRPMIKSPGCDYVWT